MMFEQLSIGFGEILKVTQSNYIDCHAQMVTVYKKDAC